MTSIRARVPFAVVLLGSALGLVLLGNPESAHVTQPLSPRVAGVPALLTTGLVRSAAWYCPMVQSADHLATGEAIAMSNTSPKVVRVEVSAIANGSVQQRKQIDVGGNATATVTGQELGTTGSVALIVEAFGPGVVVEHVATESDKTATTPCATQSSDSWYFAAGTTRGETFETIAIMNPFGQASSVDVALYTRDGVVRPRAMQALEAPARSRVQIDVNSGSDQREVIGVAIVARAGTRLIAEMMLRGVGKNASAPLSVVMGAPGLVTEWHLEDFDLRRGLTHSLVLMNPSEAPISVAVQTIATGSPQFVQRTVTVAANSIAWIDAVDPQTAAAKTDVSVTVFTHGQPFAAAALHRADATTRLVQGTSVSMGLSVPTRNATFAFDRTATLNQTVLEIENPNDRVAHIKIVRNGTADGAEITLAASQRTSLKLTSNTVASVLVIESGEPIYVVRRLFGAGGESRSAAIIAVTG